MDERTMLLAVGISVGITLLLRWLPFLVLRGEQEIPDWLQRLGKTLPPAIMAVLVLYCLKDAPGDLIGTGVPQLLAVAAVAGTYKWKHNALVSMVCGTGLYMILLRVL